MSLEQGTGGLKRPLLGWFNVFSRVGKRTTEGDGSIAARNAWKLEVARKI